ncbi:UNKNOWN [Stylonychia lemnae]|uniref:Uncharacterized protein n=1 Tax=Stylonychia lemnae TaxID=5949 RepID=A0A078A0Z2_STYLE|nr:UNKNOWN [Stylonychia lemnae]|eukprot:CDW75148.1 UNKNOWN [Stylonychia lemnae]
MKNSSSNTLVPIGSKLLDKKWKFKIDQIERDRLAKVERVMEIKEPLKPQFLSYNKKREDLEFQHQIARKALENNKKALRNKANFRKQKQSILFEYVDSFLRKLQSTRSFYNVDKWDIEHKMQEKLREGISQKTYQINQFLDQEQSMAKSRSLNRFSMNLSQIRTINDINKDSIKTTEIIDRDQIYDGQNRSRMSSYLGYSTVRSQTHSQILPQPKYKVIINTSKILKDGEDSFNMYKICIKQSKTNLKIEAIGNEQNYFIKQPLHTKDKMMKLYDFNLYKMIENLEIKDGTLFLYYPENFKQSKIKLRKSQYEKYQTNVSKSSIQLPQVAQLSTIGNNSNGNFDFYGFHTERTDTNKSRQKMPNNEDIMYLAN